MSKTVTVRLDDQTYELIRNAASGTRRSISNFIEYATVAYLSEDAFVSEPEMDDILNDTELVKDLEKGRKERDAKRYSVV